MGLLDNLTTIPLSKLDNNQRILIQDIDKIVNILNSTKSIKSNIIRKYFIKNQKDNKELKGLYLYGGIGIGKTMIMNAFMKSIYSLKVNYSHYQNFMLNVHQDIHNLGASNLDKVILNLAKHYANNWQVLCLDEFEIKDITDAMIIGRLFSELNNNNVFIFTTSNIKPDDLYKDGIQREIFLPFIDYINNNFTVIHLNNNKDYRSLNKVNLQERILYPINLETKHKIDNIINYYTSGNTLIQKYIYVFNRAICLKKTYHDILITNFEELFDKDYSYVDYVTICKHFNIIILENVKVIDQNNNDLIIRFINFIDNVYFHKILLFITLDDKPENIYKSGIHLSSFHRSLSRLNEMNSANYK